MSLQDSAPLPEFDRDAARRLLAGLDCGAALIAPDGRVHLYNHEFAALAGSPHCPIFPGASYEGTLQGCGVLRRSIGLRLGGALPGAETRERQRDLRRFDGRWIVLNERASDDGWLTVTAREEPREFRRDAAMVHVLKTAVSGGDLFAAVAEALPRSLGYQHGFVTRFARGGTRARILAQWHADSADPVRGEYTLDRTPCARIATAQHYMAWPDGIARLFPDDPYLIATHARAYAGDIYLGPGGVAEGHVFAIADQADTDALLARDVTSLIAAYIGLELQRLALRDRADAAFHEARTDLLTGLGNRLAFHEALERAVARDKTGETAVAMLDLDGLKRVNDELGHAAGDRLLALFGHGVARRLRQGDEAYRLGGDEFAVLLPRLGAGPQESVRRRLIEVAEEVRAQGFPDAGWSIGFALFSETGFDGEATVRLADERMYTDKRARKAQRVG